LKIGSLESEKIIHGAQNISNYIKFSPKFFGSAQVPIPVPNIFLEKKPDLQYFDRMV